MTAKRVDFAAAGRPEAAGVPAGGSLSLGTEATSVPSSM
jgi:hypothetical protein